MRKGFLLAIAATTLTVPTIPMAASAHSAQAQTWRGNDGRLYCRRANGTTGLVVGGAAGALVGRAIDNRGSRVTGTVLGAAAGALLGRQVQKSRSRCR